MRAYDSLGNIAIMNFPESMKFVDKKKIALDLLKENKAIKTVLEKSERVKGRLRKPGLKFVAGEKTKEALYKENNCLFKFNVETTYFSPRLSNERKEISQTIKPTDEVLVMFAGVAPFSIVIAKNSKAKMVYSNEINREANKYGILNSKLNKLQDRMEFINGDVKRVAYKLKQQEKKFDVIVMPRPQLKDSFLEQAFILSKKGTLVYYYDFCRIEDIDKIVEKVKREASRMRKNIKIIKVKKAGEIAPYKIRVRVDFKILN